MYTSERPGERLSIFRGPFNIDKRLVYEAYKAVNPIVGLPEWMSRRSNSSKPANSPGLLSQYTWGTRNRSGQTKFLVLKVKAMVDCRILTSNNRAG